jgi:hypothetical protein
MFCFQTLEKRWLESVRVRRGEAEKCLEGGMVELFLAKFSKNLSKNRKDKLTDNKLFASFPFRERSLREPIRLTFQTSSINRGE